MTSAMPGTKNPLVREPFERYRQQSKSHLTSHALADFRKSPRLHRDKQLGLIPDVDRPAFVVGRAAHTLVLEGPEVFEKTYAVGGPVNPKTGNPYGANTKAFAEWAAEQGKPVLTETNFDLVAHLAASVRGHDVAAELLDGVIAEGVVRMDYCGVPCQIRMDAFSPARGIVDLKTADDIDWFEADARRYGYAYQLAFYRAVLAVALGEAVPVHMVAVEKKPPFRCGVWRVGEDVLGMVQKENEAAIGRLRKCREADTWPTGLEAVRVFDYL